MKDYQSVWQLTILNHVVGASRREVQNVTKLSRQQVQNFTKIIKSVKIIECHCYVLDHHKKCIEISTNMPTIGLFFRETGLKMWEFLQTNLGKSKMAAVL